jgi:hypothetical protein
MHIYYEFLFSSGRIESFDLSFHEHDFSLLPLSSGEEDWTRLEYHQCSLCPLRREDQEYCPVARNLSHVLARFRHDNSHDLVRVRTTVDERITERKGDLQTGISSIMGLIMATSGCPILDTFKPMAYTHLPFANEAETIFRSVSTYLTAQYVRMCHGLTPDWTLSNFIPSYSAVQQVNAAFIERLRSVFISDANLNALILLDAIAQFGAFALKDNWLGQVEPLFSAHLQE